MFWGLILKANKKYTQAIKQSFHLSHAALDITSASDGPVQVVLTSDKNNYILCTLKKDSVQQVALDLNFEEGEEISFTSQGQGNVHLSGYIVIDEVGQFDDEDNDDQDEDELVEIKKGKKGGMKNQDEEDDSEDDDEEDDEEELEDNSDGDEEDDDSEDESEDLEVEEPVSKQRKLDKPKLNGFDKQPVVNKKAKKEITKDQTKGEKVLPGGVKIDDIRIGQGPEAKTGKKVQVYYEGKLKSNNKIFDSTKQGAGFKFGLGKGQVIKAWDVGIVGMKVGGKRRITCPPHMAYGSKGSPPTIPPNSTLVFEVELKGVN